MSLIILGTISNKAVYSQETRNYDMKGFTGVKNSTSAEVEITQLETYKIEVTAKSDVFNELEIVVKDNTLHVKTKDTYNIWGNWGKVLVKISCPEIKALSQNGSGNIKMQTPIITPEELTISVNGSGDILMKEIQTKSVQVSINGSGNVKTTSSGSAEVLKVNSNGSGNVNLETLKVSSAQVKLNGSGNATINCSKAFKGSINGSGNIVLYGNPLIDVKVNGSGRLMRKTS